MRWLYLPAYFLMAYPAFAEDVGATPCVEVRAIMDDPDKRHDDLMKTAHWVFVRFKVDDDSWTAAGHDSLVDKWSEDGLEGNFSLVTASCAEHRDDTLAQRTDAVFLGLGAIETQFGSLK